MMNLADATDRLKLLGDPTRVRLLALLAREELTVAELTRITRLAQSRVSTHLGRLREAGFVRDRPDGASSYYTLNPAMPDAARGLWELVASAARDPLLEHDALRLQAAIRARHGDAPWADTVAGQMERHYSPGRTWEAALRGLLGLLRLGAVLDIASGDSALAELVAPRARSITCLDASPTVLRAGRRRLARLDHVSFCRGDMHALPFPDGRFDQVLLLACLCYAEDPARAAAEAARTLRPGGALVAVTLLRHEHEAIAARYNHLQNGFEPAELRRLFERAGLDVALCEVTSRERRLPHFEVVTLHATKAT
jgi:ArsR family transcriptional regulator